MNSIFFKNQNDLRKWFMKNHKTQNELLVGYYKKSTGKPSVTWPESVDEALCFGWIDGIRKSLDDISYTIRFTPRNPKSTWSAKNIKRINELIKLGLVQPAGLAAFKKLDEKNSKIYSYEQNINELSNDFKKLFKRNNKAWNYFQKLIPSLRNPSIRWVMSAKKEETRLSRLNRLIQNCENEELIPELRWGRNNTSD